MKQRTRALSPASQLCKLASLIGLMALGMQAAMAQSAFDTPDPDYQGQIMAMPAEGGAITAGSDVQLMGRGFKPGQHITLTRGTTVLNTQAYVADDQGGFKGALKVPADAAVGQQPIVVTVSNPSAAAVLPLKISPVLPLSGTERFKQTSSKLVPGLYQSAVSARTGAIFVTSAVGRPPVKQSQLLKLNPATLAVEAQVTPAVAAEGGDVYAVYGVGVDDRNGTVWVTNTRQSSVAVYRQSDLTLVKQFAPDTVAHARDVVVDTALDKAFAGATGTARVVMFDAGKQTVERNIDIKSTLRGEQAPAFSVASLHLDTQTHTLYTVSLSTNEAAIIDAKTGNVEKVFPIQGVKMAMGVAYDGKTNRLFVVGQNSDNLAIVDVASGKTLHLVPTGAGPLNVTFDPVKGLAYVSNRGAGTVTVVDADGKLVANLDDGTFPNHVATDAKGNVYAVNKSKGPDDQNGDRITRITQVR